MTDPREYYTDRQDRSDIDDEHFEAEQLASALAEIRRRYSMTNYAVATDGHITSALTASSADVPRLLAALDVVLELAGEWDADGVKQRAEFAERVHPALASGHKEANLLQGHAAGLRSAITNALLSRRENPDAH